MAIKKNSGKSNGKGITKSGFIRSLPDRTPAKEVIAKAKEAGLELKEKLIWTVQSEMRSEANGGAKKPAKKTAQTTSAASAAASSRAPAAASAKSNGKKGSKKKAPAKAAAKATTIAHSSGAEQKMKALILQLGTTRADELYRSVRKELDALVAN